MAQTFTRVNKTRKESEVVDNRRNILSKETKNLNKHRRTVYELVDQVEDEFYEFDDYDNYDRQ